MSLATRLRALLGFSAYTKPSSALALPSLGDKSVERIRQAHGGNIQLPPQSEARWYLADVEDAWLAADRGDLAAAARLMRAARTDGILSGVLSTRTDGLVRLPKRFYGHREIVDALASKADYARPVFDELAPPSELAQMTADGITLGVAVGELVPVEGRDFPVLVRLDPEYLVYRWNEAQWYFRSVAGLIPITPGDGRWVLHCPGGRLAPWNAGLWRALGTAWVRKHHAQLSKDSWESTLAHPARIAEAPNGASEEAAGSWFSQVVAWGRSTVFGIRPGYSVRLLESNGRGHESFSKTIAEQNEEMIIAVAGQTVTTDGGAGFSNSAVHQSIRADLIEATADSLAHTINTQILPAFVLSRFGEAALAHVPSVDFDVTPPADKAREAQTLLSAAQAITQLSDALGKHGRKLDVDALATRFGIPTMRGEDVELIEDGEVVEDDAPKLALLPGGAQ